MKFLHIADMHFDAPFSFLNTKKNLGETRRLEQRSVFKDIIKYVKDNDIGYLFIAGDLYEHEYVRRSTIDFINDCFKEIRNTKIFITPGNHDPYIKDSIYETYEFENNVHIFNKPELQKYEDDKVVIYGMAFDGFYMNESILENVRPESREKTNILIAHADVNGSKDEEGLEYNNIAERYLRNTGFDYIALGHIHKNNFDMNEDFVYPGSTISFGFDELGKHGAVVGEIENHSITKEFVEFDTRVFEELELKIDSFSSKESLIEYVLGFNLRKNSMYKLVLTGRRNFEINPRELIKSFENINILKVKDMTKLNYDLHELSKENNLKGIFIRKVMERGERENLSDEEIEKIIEIGLDAMD